MHNLPFGSIGDLLRGREQAVKDLLSASGPAAITQAIQGLGGVGKTRLAVEIGWRAVGEGRRALFVLADSSESLHSNLAALAGRLGLPEAKATEEEAVCEAVLRWLERNEG